MSRIVIRDIVIPVVSRILAGGGYLTPAELFEIRDERLEEFLEEEMRRRFGVIGSNGCQHLREQLEEAKKNDPYAFEFFVRQILEKYAKLAAEVKNAPPETFETGPPDRFSELRKKYVREHVTHL